MTTTASAESSVAVSATAVPEDYPYTEEEVKDLADLLAPLQYFFGVDVRGPESAMQTAKDLLMILHDLGYEALELTDEAKEALDAKRDPEGGAKAAEASLKEAQAAEKAASTTSSSSSSDPSSSSKSTVSTSSSRSSS
jgi:hypothetical protein